MRARCLAAFDLDPSKTDSLSFGSRGYRRLRVSLHTDVQTSYSTLPIHRPLADIHDDMESAQLEAFDEDLYNEVGALAFTPWLSLIPQIQNEVGRHPSGTVTFRSAILDMGQHRLAFEMVSLRSQGLSADPSSATPGRVHRIPRHPKCATRSLSLYVSRYYSIIDAGRCVWLDTHPLAPQSFYQ